MKMPRIDNDQFGLHIVALCAECRNPNQSPHRECEKLWWGML